MEFWFLQPASQNSLPFSRSELATTLSQGVANSDLENGKVYWDQYCSSENSATGLTNNNCKMKFSINFLIRFLCHDLKDRIHMQGFAIVKCKIYVFSDFEAEDDDEEIAVVETAPIWRFGGAQAAHVSDHKQKQCSLEKALHAFTEEFDWNLLIL